MLCPALTKDNASLQINFLKSIQRGESMPKILLIEIKAEQKITGRLVAQIQGGKGYRRGTFRRASLCSCLSNGVKVVVETLSNRVD